MGKSLRVSAKIITCLFVILPRSQDWLRRGGWRFGCDWGSKGGSRIVARGFWLWSRFSTAGRRLRLWLHDRLWLRNWANCYRNWVWGDDWIGRYDRFYRVRSYF